MVVEAAKLKWLTVFTRVDDAAILQRATITAFGYPMNRLHPPAPVLEIADRLERAGFEAWCVGGAIRDALLGHDHLDWDLATSATPTQVRELFGESRIIPVGVQFGTLGVLDRERLMHEVTTFRRDVRTDGRHADVEFGVSLEDDLARRDFTINAMAYSPRLRQLRDPFGGQADIANRIVRAVGDPEARMREDRLRALRAIRFAARFGFEIDAPTRAALATSADFLGQLSPERVKQELDKTMGQVRRPSAAFRLWQQTGAFRTLIPELDGIRDSSLTVPDYLALPRARGRPARRILRFAGLLAGLSPDGAGRVLSRLRSSRAETQSVVLLVEGWHRFGTEIGDSLNLAVDPADSLVRRWVAGVGRLQVASFMRLADGIWAAARDAGQGAPARRGIGKLYRRMLHIAFAGAIDLGSLVIDGDDLRRTGIPPGPGLGKILQHLLAAVIEDPTRNAADWLLQEARRLHEVSGNQ